MLKKLIASIFGSRNERLLKTFQTAVAKINDLEATMRALTDSELQAKTTEFKQRLAKGKTLDSLLPEAFAVVRESAYRVLKMRHFDTQLIGGMVLHSGKIAEMRTGEGKTLMATLPVYLNALTGRGVHVVTVNDYLARRDADWMLPLYEFLGMSVGVIISGQDHPDKKAAYDCDITYGTNNEYGFDYLRDNMAFSPDQKVQRDLHFALIDEVDSILIDEARTPLIISGPAEESSELYRAINKLVPKLVRKQAESSEGDYELDEKTRQVYLTESGQLKLEDLLADAMLLKDGKGLYDLTNISLLHHLIAALRAHAAFHKNIDYIVQNDEIIIVDEHTGRTMPGRRWSDGLHQAIEAKEGVTIQSENVTLASITFQNYFRLYDKLGGMTGTADTEAYEFQQIYGLEVVVIPTNRPMIRQDLGDQIYLTTLEKYQAVINDIKECRVKQQPVLVGTASIEASEYLSGLLNQEKIPHQVLNAKFHEKEAEIIAQAGRPGALTIATNMAGRGTDIVLGGNVEAEIANLTDPTPETIADLRKVWEQDHKTVIAAGGLHIIGSERHESRRIDNQLRGRAGRQGDPGSSRFYLSLQDNLMRIFASDRIAMLMKRLGMKEGEAIEHSWVSKAVENAQRKVEGHNFDIRKQLLEYDDVANDQRRVVYAQRAELMATDDISEMIQQILQQVIVATFHQYVPADSLEEQWDIPGLERQIHEDYQITLPIHQWLEVDENLQPEILLERITTELLKAYQEKETQVGASVVRHFEKTMMLQLLDNHWREHLAAMDHLRQGIGLRGYAQKNPKQEYKREAFIMFNEMLTQIKHDLATVLVRSKFVAEQDIPNPSAMEKNWQPNHIELPELATDKTVSIDRNHVTVTRDNHKIGRNDPCFCGSGKKYKHCHGNISQ